MRQHPERHSIYDAAKTGGHGAETELVLTAYDFAGFRTVVDIGGGNGSTLVATLKRHLGIRGILFDLPEVTSRAQALIARAGLADRCRTVGGDFFASLPAGADAYLLRHVLHDWEDPDAVPILGNCREAMPPQGRVLVVEMVLPPGNTPRFGKWLDLMMPLVEGRERTEAEYRFLFGAAGMELNRVVPKTAEVTILKAVRGPVLF